MTEPPAADEPPLAGGVFRRLGALVRRWGVSVPVIEELYGPTRHESRIRVEEQRELAEPSPAPGDPPGPHDGEEQETRSRFHGRLRVRRR